MILFDIVYVFMASSNNHPNDLIISATANTQETILTGTTDLDNSLSTLVVIRKNQLQYTKDDTSDISNGSTVDTKINNVDSHIEHKKIGEIHITNTNTNTNKNTNKNDNIDELILHASSIYNFSGEPILLGQEYCINNEKYNSFTHLRVEGMYNSGTNALYKLVNQNCFGIRALRNSFRKKKVRRAPKKTTSPQNRNNRNRNRHSPQRQKDDININIDMNGVDGYEYGGMGMKPHTVNVDLTVQQREQRLQMMHRLKREQSRHDGQRDSQLYDNDALLMDELRKRDYESLHQQQPRIERRKRQLRAKPRGKGVVTSAGGDALPSVELLSQLDFDNVNFDFNVGINRDEYNGIKNSNNRSDVLKYLEDNIIPNMNYVDTVYRSAIGKHNMNPTPNDIQYYKHSAFGNFAKVDETLNVVIIKDPLTWIQSLCKEPYEISMLHYPKPIKTKSKLKRKSKAQEKPKPASKTYAIQDQPSNDKHYKCPTHFSDIITNKTQQKLSNFFAQNTDKNDSTNQREEYYGSLIWHGMYWNSLIEFYNQWYLSWFGSTQAGSQSQYHDIKTSSNQSPHDETVYWSYDFGKKNFENFENFDDGQNKIDYQWSNWGSKDGFQLNVEQQQNMKRFGHTMEQPAKIPTIIVRFEDLLFRPEKLTQNICNCIGGVTRKNMNIIDKKGKSHGQSRSRTQALRVYSNPNYRYKPFADNDIDFMKQYLDQRLLGSFMYNV